MSFAAAGVQAHPSDLPALPRPESAIPLQWPCPCGPGPHGVVWVPFEGAETTAGDASVRGAGSAALQGGTFHRGRRQFPERSSGGA